MILLLSVSSPISAYHESQQTGQTGVNVASLIDSQRSSSSDLLPQGKSIAVTCLPAKKLLSDWGVDAGSWAQFHFRRNSYSLRSNCDFVVCSGGYYIFFFLKCITWLGKSDWNLEYVGCHLIEFPHLAAGEFVFGTHYSFSASKFDRRILSGVAV